MGYLQKTESKTGLRKLRWQRNWRCETARGGKERRVDTFDYMALAYTLTRTNVAPSRAHADRLESGGGFNLMIEMNWEGFL